jgi:hypothetical protein
MSTVEQSNNARTTSVATLSSGSGYASFPDVPCQQMDLINNSGTTVEYLRSFPSGQTIAIPVITASSRLIVGLRNASEISVRRTDLSVTPVTVIAECFR